LRQREGEYLISHPLRWLMRLELHCGLQLQFALDFVVSR
jgi:hypothetical protein